jgi:hypothetical protein
MLVRIGVVFIGLKEFNILKFFTGFSNVGIVGGCVSDQLLTKLELPRNLENSCWLGVFIINQSMFQ